MTITPKAVSWISLFGAPAFWIVQMSTSQIITSLSCHSHGNPLAALANIDLEVILAGIDLFCFLGGLTCYCIARKNWKQTRVAALHENSDLITASSRARFLGILSIMSSLLFTAAILFTCCAAFLVSPCAR